MLALLVREPFSGMTAAIYAATPDVILVQCYLAARDEDGVLITEKGRKAKSGKAEQKERLRNAGKELPKPSDLSMPDGILAWATRRRAIRWAVMWWQVWRSRGLSAEATLERWRGKGYGED